MRRIRKQRREGKRWRTIFLCGRQKENISRIRSCLIHVWLVCTERFPLAVQIIFSEETVAASVT